MYRPHESAVDQQARHLEKFKRLYMLVGYSFVLGREPWQVVHKN